MQLSGCNVEKSAVTSRDVVLPEMESRFVSVAALFFTILYLISS